MSERLVHDRYRLGRRLGAGSVGTVWQAHDERLDREVAVKIVPGIASRDPAARERFRREAVATARLNHPGIVTVFDTGTDGDDAYLVMALVPGRSLAQVVRDLGALPLTYALDVTGQVLAALQAAHAAGFVHRDIKPANVMVDDEGHVTVLDFGVARLAEDATLTAPDSAVGTAAYMSPEQAAGQPVTAATDVYAVGCLLMTLLTGAPPFTGDNAVAVASQQVGATPPRLSSRVTVPVALDALVARTLGKDPAGRPDAAELRTALAEIRRHRDAAVVGPGSTATLPVAEPARAVATASPAADRTAVLPAAAAPQSHRTPAAPPPAPTPPAVAAIRRRGVPGWVALLALAVLGVIVYAVGSSYAARLPALPSVTPRPATSPTAPPVTPPPAPASSAKPATTPPSRPASTAPVTTAPATPPALPSQVPSAVTSAARVAAADTVGATIDRLPDGKGKAKLQNSWRTERPKILAGDKANDRISDLEADVRASVVKGDLALSDSVPVIAALEALRRTLG